MRRVEEIPFERYPLSQEIASDFGFDLDDGSWLSRLRKCTQATALGRTKVHHTLLLKLTDFRRERG
jgi:hypothetical protein